jgi:hypothetical protein
MTTTIGTACSIAVNANLIAYRNQLRHVVASLEAS